MSVLVLLMILSLLACVESNVMPIRSLNWMGGAISQLMLASITISLTSFMEAIQVRKSVAVQN